MRYTLRQLEVFLAVSRSESVTRAGELLALSQSAVSSAIADLERQLEAPLFDRAGKRLRLSERAAHSAPERRGCGSARRIWMLRSAPVRSRPSGSARR